MTKANGNGPPENPLDADLARVVQAWPGLPETARRMILAAVEAAGGPPG